MAAFRVTRGRRTVALGKLKLARDHTARAHIRGLQPGRYTLTVTVAHGRTHKVLLRESIMVR
jgi:hypothetical protein